MSQCAGREDVGDSTWYCMLEEGHEGLCMANLHSMRTAFNDGMLHAARLCEVKVARDAEYGGRFGGYGPFMGDKTGPECAADIRKAAQ